MIYYAYYSILKAKLFGASIYRTIEGKEIEATTILPKPAIMSNEIFVGQVKIYVGPGKKAKNYFKIKSNHIEVK
jgi:hypothetical protein